MPYMGSNPESTARWIAEYDDELHGYDTDPPEEAPMTETKRDTFNRQYADREELRDSARKYAASLIDDFENGEIGEGYTYAHDRLRTERFLLAGGGPTAWAVFVLKDGEVDTAFIEYVEFDSEIAILPSWIAPELYETLKNT